MSPRWTADDTAWLIHAVIEDDMRRTPSPRKEAAVGFQITARIRGDDAVANQHTIDQLITTIEQLYDLIDNRCSMGERMPTCRYHPECRDIGKQRGVIMDRLIAKLDAWEHNRERVA